MAFRRHDATSARLSAPADRKGSATRDGVTGSVPWTMSEAGEVASPRLPPADRCTRPRHTVPAGPLSRPPTADRADATGVRRAEDRFRFRSHQDARARQPVIPTRPPAAGHI